MFKRSVILLSIVTMLLSASAFADGRSSVQKAVTTLGDSYLVSAPAAAFRRGIALLPLKVPESLASKGVGSAVEAFIREKLSQSTVFILVERGNMAALMKEMELGMSGIVDESTAAKAGALIGAELLVQGSISETGDGLSLSLEIVDVSTGTVAASLTRPLERADLIADANQFQRDAFRSQYGLSIGSEGGLLFPFQKQYYTSPLDHSDTVEFGTFLSASWAAGISYRILPFLSLDLGGMGLVTPQFFLTSDGKILSPNGTERTVRYTAFEGSGVRAGLGYVYSPIPRLNLSLGASGFILASHQMSHKFMGFACLEVLPSDPGVATPVNRDFFVYGKTFNPPLGLAGGLKADFLISRRLSLGLSVDYLWMKPYRPEYFESGNITNSDTVDADHLENLDRNGTFDFMGTFYVDRVDGTLSTGYISFNPSGIAATLSLAVHF